MPLVNGLTPTNNLSLFTGTLDLGGYTLTLEYPQSPTPPSLLIDAWLRCTIIQNGRLIFVCNGFPQIDPPGDSHFIFSNTTLTLTNLNVEYQGDFFNNTGKNLNGMVASGDLTVTESQISFGNLLATGNGSNINGLYSYSGTGKVTLTQSTVTFGSILAVNEGPGLWCPWF